jgi:hypothetical protein
VSRPTVNGPRRPHCIYLSYKVQILYVYIICTHKPQIKPRASSSVKALMFWPCGFWKRNMNNLSVIIFHFNIYHINKPYATFFICKISRSLFKGLSLIRPVIRKKQDDLRRINRLFSFDTISHRKRCLKQFFTVVGICLPSHCLALIWKIHIQTHRLFGGIAELHWDGIVLVFYHPVALVCSLTHVLPSLMQFYSHFLLISKTWGLKVKSRVTCFGLLVYHQPNVLWQNCHAVFLNLKHINAIRVVVHSSNALVWDVLLIPSFLCGFRVMCFYVWPCIYLSTVFIYAVGMCPLVTLISSLALVIEGHTQRRITRAPRKKGGIRNRSQTSVDDEWMTITGVLLLATRRPSIVSFLQ